MFKNKTIKNTMLRYFLYICIYIICRKYRKYRLSTWSFLLGMVFLFCGIYTSFLIGTVILSSKTGTQVKSKTIVECGYFSRQIQAISCGLKTWSVITIIIYAKKYLYVLRSPKFPQLNFNNLKIGNPIISPYRNRFIYT